MVKSPPEMEETQVQSLGAWIIPWTEEPGRLRSRELDTTEWLTLTADISITISKMRKRERASEHVICALTVSVQLRFKSRYMCSKVPVHIHCADSLWISRAVCFIIQAFQTHLLTMIATPFLLRDSCCAKSWLIWKDPDAGKDWGQEEKGTTEDEMVG